MDYLIRAETASSRLKQAKETFSDSLLIAMVIKGLPDRFKPFTTVIAQQNSDNSDFAKFKMALITYEENERARESHCSGDNDVILSVGNNYTSNNKLKYYACGQEGRLKMQCKSLNQSKNKDRK